MLEWIVRQAQIVRPEGVLQADLGIAEGKIARLEPEIAEPAHQEIRAEGLHLFPGAIDVHVHFNQPGHTDWEGIASGSAALAAGGGALFVDMPLNSVPCTLDAESFDLKLAVMRSLSATDFALWGGLTPGNLEHLPELAARGVVGFKAFMSNSGLPEFPSCDVATLYEGMKVAAELGLPIAVHAESDALTAHLTQTLRAQGKTTWRDYLASRPVFTELEAIAQALILARETGCKLHIVHISSGSGVALAAEAKTQGVDVSLETCPHYLAFSEADLERLATREVAGLRFSALTKCAPPLRSELERELLWSQVLEGKVDLIGSDHSPSPAHLKQGQDTFAQWGGVAGVQSTLGVLLREGWHRRGLPLEAIAGMLAEAPARRFGLEGKGRLEPGYDADFTLVDLHQSFTLQPEDLFYRHKLSPYLGQNFIGRVQRTFIRGQPVFADGTVRPVADPTLIRPRVELPPSPASFDPKESP